MAWSGSRFLQESDSEDSRTLEKVELSRTESLALRIFLSGGGLRTAGEFPLPEEDFSAEMKDGRWNLEERGIWYRKIEVEKAGMIMKETEGEDAAHHSNVDGCTVLLVYMVLGYFLVFFGSSIYYIIFRLNLYFR